MTSTQVFVPEKYRMAPYPYFGGKRSIAPEVWERLGSPIQYIEPFCGSAAVLLAAPEPASLEVIGDMNFFIANFWRCIKFQPEATYEWQDYPVSHVDLDARHRWLTDPNRTANLLERLRDPEWKGDAQIAGWWVWGQCCWIGSGWCEKEFQSDRDNSMLGKVPHVSDAGRGVLDWFRFLASRLEKVRVIHGDWTRCLNHHYAGDNTAIFFDPPYIAFEKLYHKDGQRPVAAEVALWCAEHESEARIALCGLKGDYDLPGWTIMPWTRARPTYNSFKTTEDEAIWFSPSCHKLKTHNQSAFDFKL